MPKAKYNIPKHRTSFFLSDSTLQNGKTNIDTLNKELKILYHSLVPHKSDLVARNSIVLGLRNYIECNINDVNVFVSGSFDYGCYLTSSNINFVVKEKTTELCKKLSAVKITNKKSQKSKEQYIMDKLHTILSKSDAIQSNTIRACSKNKSAILACKSAEANYNLEFTYGSSVFEAQSNYVKRTFEDHKARLPLFYILKYFMDMRELNSRHGSSFLNYHLFLLLHSFCDLHPIMKNLKIVNNLGILLMDFFQFYGCIFRQSYASISKDGRYKAKAHDDDSISIIDPITKLDIGRSCKASYLVRQAFAHCYLIMHLALTDKNNKQKSFISLWFGNTSDGFQ